MVDTAYFQTVGGSVLLLDIPEEGTDARSRFDLQVGKGELVIIDDQSRVEAVEVDGATTYKLNPPVEAAKPSRAKKAAPDEGE